MCALFIMCALSVSYVYLEDGLALHQLRHGFGFRV
jgi:hypothetical protein